MSVGNPKKFENFDKLEKELNANEKLSKEADDVRIYKDQNSRTKKALHFRTHNDKPKLA